VSLLRSKADRMEGERLKRPTGLRLRARGAHHIYRALRAFLQNGPVCHSGAAGQLRTYTLAPEAVEVEATVMAASHPRAK
jgi:hypothetical protein